MSLLHPVMSTLGIKSEEQLLAVLAWAMIASGFCSFVALQIVRAPYGKYWEEAGKAYGCMMNGRLAWLLQEAPAFALPVYFWISEGSDPASDGRMTSLTPNTVLMAMFLLHYLHRTFIFPFRLRGGKPTPFLVFLLALIFCLWNGYLQGRSLTHFRSFEPGYWREPNFVLGVAAFFIGMGINLHSDTVLLRLRKGPSDRGYYIPTGGMFHYVSGANFFGEILEWAGWALATWSLPAAAFALFTFCNIGPRGAQHHAWYKAKFGDKYPRRRKAVIPWLW